MRFWLYVLACFLVVVPSHAQRAAPSTAAPTAAAPTAAAPTAVPIAATQYHAQLQRAATQLHEMEDTPSRPLAPLISKFKLNTDSKVRRADGTLQHASGDEWQRRAIEAPGNATRQQVRAARESLEARLQALEDWQQRKANGAYFAGAEAQTRLNQLEGSGLIRTGPTAAEAWWSRTKKTLLDLWKSLTNWMSRTMPAPTTQAPEINPVWIQALFIASILALLGVIGWLVWRAVGNPFATRRRDTGSDPFNEDEALLHLPPDELLERARAFARAGDFREALRHVYIRLLLQLDARGVWRYDTRRTNWEHIELLRRQPAHAALALPLSDLTRRFDRVRYGGASCDNSEWQRFEHDALSLEQQVSGGKQEADGRRQSTQKLPS